MKSRKKIYDFWVNKQAGISIRYHRVHDNATGFKKVLSWLYLLWLNFAYYCLFCKSLGKRPNSEIYETKNVSSNCSESEAFSQEEGFHSADDILNRTADADVVSFDIFDTLIFRSISIPTDVFLLVQEKLGIPDFKSMRIWAEAEARSRCFVKNGHYEVTLTDIWNVLSEELGCDVEEGMRLEVETELKVCYANPFMKEVWDRLRGLNKDIIIVSDMYLPSKAIEMILEKNGFTGYKKLYVSCEYGKNKASGSLFELVQSENSGKNIIHIGDNPRSDFEMARKNGFGVCPYTNVNKNVLMYRPFDMSSLTGSAYRALVSNRIYNGLCTYSMEYEYGFIYGGLFALGYCNFIHEYVHKNNVDKVLFLSRDGEILKKVYDNVFPEDKAVSEYVYWSRKAATKLMADFDKHDYFRRFIYHKINQGYTIEDTLKSMELECLVAQLPDWKEIWKDWAGEQLEDEKSMASNAGKTFDEEKCREKIEKRFVDLKASDKLTEKNGFLLRKFVEAKWNDIFSVYGPQQEAAKKYYKDILEGSKKAVAVDIGWAGSGALALDYLVNRAWNLNCDITGLIAGTNTIHNAEADATDAFLQSGKLVAYLYSPAHNRDLYKKHDPNKDYNVFWELLLSSPTPKFQGFVLKEDGSVGFDFGKYDENLDGIRDIQSGIMDFVKDYTERFKDFPYMLNISGRDAYAPMLVAASHDEKYLKAVEKKFSLEIQVN